MPMPPASDHPRVARVLRVDLARPASARVEPWSDPDPRIERLGRAGGSALGLALLHRARREGADGANAPLVISVGAAVRAALPTAARASVASISPLTGELSEGQVGGTLARSLARVADACVLFGSTPAGGAVLVVREDATVELLVEPALVGEPPRAVARMLLDRLGPCAALAIGAAGEARVPFASLATLADPPSFVGRGGLGAVMGRLGLKALAVVARAVEPDPARAEADRELQRALARSPRLRARSEGGTLELAALHARSSELGAVAGDLAALVGASRDKQGCEGCPTPCGLVFERAHPRGTTRHLGRFGALRALSARLALSVEEARALLERCDELALDAKEAGAVLALARERLTSEFDAARAHELLDLLVTRSGIGAVLALGSREAARAWGLPGASRGASVLERVDPSLAVRLGAAVSARGSDPMRTFPFLALDAASRERMAAVMQDVPLPRGAEDPADPAGKGRIVWWHENLALALDATGFCAFSAAGLLSDGIVTLDELARWIGPPEIARAARPARALLALGASLALVARHHAGAPASVDDPELGAPGLWPEYRHARGLDERGAVTERAWSALGSEVLLDVPFDARATAPAEDAEAKPDITVVGRVSFGGGGALGRALSGRVVLERALPARLVDCLAELAVRAPAAESWLFHDGRVVPQAWRGDRRVDPRDWVVDGDHIELVVAVGGG